MRTLERSALAAFNSLSRAVRLDVCHWGAGASAAFFAVLLTRFRGPLSSLSADVHKIKQCHNIERKEACLRRT